MESWRSKLDEGHSRAAWDLFDGTYRRLILATIRRLVQDHDDVMDVFSTVCQGLSANGFARLRRYSERSPHGASVATWLVTVVRNLSIDWIRQQEGRRRLGAPSSGLRRSPPDVRLAVELFVIDKLSAAEVARAVGWPNAKAVYNRVYRALALMRAGLEREGIGPGDL